MSDRRAAELELPPGEVHLWYGVPTELAGDAKLADCRRTLSPSELSCCDRFVQMRDRQLYLASHALLRCVLSQYAGVAPNQWQFRTRPHGKPFVAGPLAEDCIRVNLSHTAGLVACAVSLDREVGVDVESIERQIELVSLAQRFFSPTEVAALASFPAERRHLRFYQYWTLKESFIKAVGKGLAMPLDSFSMMLPADTDSLALSTSIGTDNPLTAATIEFRPSAEASAPAERNATAWQFAQYLPTPQHVLAVAIHREGRPEQTVVLRRATPAFICADN